MATVNIDFQVRNADTLQKVASTLAKMGKHTEDFAQANDLASRALQRQIAENAKLEALQKRLNKAITAGNISKAEANKIMAQATKEAARRVRQDKELIQQEERLEKARKKRIADLAKEQKALSDLKAQYNPLYAAERRMQKIREDNLRLQKADAANKSLYAQRIKEAERDLKQFTRAIKENNGALIDSGNQFARFNTQAFNARKQVQKFGSSGLQQAGYQIQDFAVQVASGQNALLAFGQQFSQLISVAGPYGAAVGALVAVGVAIYRVYEASRDATKISEELDKSYQELEKRVTSLTDAYVNLNMTLDERKQFSNVPALQEELMIRERLLEVAIAQSRLAAGGGAITDPFRSMFERLLGAGSGLKGAAEATGTSMGTMADLSRLSTDIFSPGLQGLQEQYDILKRVSEEIRANISTVADPDKRGAGLVLYSDILQRMQLINFEIERTLRNKPEAVQRRLDRSVGEVEQNAKTEKLKEDITQLELALQLEEDATTRANFRLAIDRMRAELRRTEIEAVRKQAKEEVMAAAGQERLNGDQLRFLNEKAEAAADAAQALFEQRENTKELTAAVAEAAKVEKEREEQAKRMISAYEVQQGYLKDEQDAFVKLLEARGQSEAAEQRQVELAGERAAQAVLIKATTEEEAVALQGVAEEARNSAENTARFAIQMERAKEETRLLEAAAASVARTLGALANIGANVQTQIAVTRARIAAMDAGASAEIAGRIETINQNAKTAYDEAVKAADDLLAAGGNALEVQESKNQALADYNQVLADTLVLQGLLTEEEAKAAALRAAEAAARRDASAGKKASDAETKNAENLQEYLAGLAAEVNFLEQTRNIFGEQLVLEQQIHSLRQQYGPAFTSQIEAQTRALLEQKQVLEEQKDVAMRVGQAIGNAFGTFLTDIVSGTVSVEEAFKKMALSIINELFRILVVEKLVKSISTAVSGSFSQGAAFSGGSVVPFANGGVVGGPTLFPMAGGHTGLMGEAGPEAIMPLKRGKDGKLGVEANNTNAAPVVNQKIVNVLDPSVMSEYLSSRDGEKVIMNVIRRNRNG